jgi:hypothetical protein
MQHSSSQQNPLMDCPTAAYRNKAGLNANFISQFSTHLYFGNSAEEFYPHETLSAPMKLLSSLSSLTQCHVSIFNAHETL